MARLITRGRFTHDYVKGLLAAPEDREPVVRKLIEGAGGKMISFYFTTGESDFLLVSEANEPEVHHRRANGSGSSRNNFGHKHCAGLDREGIQGNRR